MFGRVGATPVKRAGVPTREGFGGPHPCQEGGQTPHAFSAARKARDASGSVVAVVEPSLRL